jgi:hypothetical protein
MGKSLWLFRYKFQDVFFKKSDIHARRQYGRSHFQSNNYWSEDENNSNNAYNVNLNNGNVNNNNNKNNNNYVRCVRKMIL